MSPGRRHPGGRRGRRLRAGGRRECNNFLLPFIISFLNDREWQLRAAFYAAVVPLALHAGTAGFDHFLRPCLEQAPSPPPPSRSSDLEQATMRPLPPSPLTHLRPIRAPRSKRDLRARSRPGMAE